MCRDFIFDCIGRFKSRNMSITCRHFVDRRQTKLKSKHKMWVSESWLDVVIVVVVVGSGGAAVCSLFVCLFVLVFWHSICRGKRLIFI